MSRIVAPPGDPRAGFSMVEVIIAIIILAVGVLGLAGSTAHIVRQITLSDLMTERAVAFQTVVEQIQAMPYDSVSAGTDSIGIYALSWTVTPDGAQSSLVKIFTDGPGLSGDPPTNNPHVVDSFEFRILRR